MERSEKQSLVFGASAAIPAIGVGLSWLCCLPLALGGLGAGAAAFGAWLAPLRPYLAWAAVLLLAGAFRQAYRPRACADDEACARPGRRVLLWTMALLTLALLTIDRWGSWVVYWSL